jgi:hypothetical protein
MRYCLSHERAMKLREKGEDAMKITVRIRQVYGTETIYPICENAQTFAAMVGQKTLTQRNLQLIRKLGYAVEVEQQTLAA